jgi:hypothetical protein
MKKRVKDGEASLGLGLKRIHERLDKSIKIF